MEPICWIPLTLFLVLLRILKMMLPLLDLNVEDFLDCLRPEFLNSKLHFHFLYLLYCTVPAVRKYSVFNQLSNLTSCTLKPIAAFHLCIRSIQWGSLLWESSCLNVTKRMFRMEHFLEATIRAKSRSNVLDRVMDLRGIFRT